VPHLAELATDADVAEGRRVMLIVALLRDDEDLEAAIARAAELDEDIAEFAEEALEGLPADERARQIVSELASRG
jgi:hypothetical protein